jgi:hypothetical protein
LLRSHVAENASPAFCKVRIRGFCQRFIAPTELSQLSRVGMVIVFVPNHVSERVVSFTVKYGAIEKLTGLVRE